MHRLIRGLGSVDVKPPLPFPPGGMMIPGAAGIVRVPPPAAAAARGRGAGAQGSGAPARYKKAPDAPKRFKSAFIIFSAEKHKEIKEAHLKVGRTEKVRFIGSTFWLLELVRNSTLLSALS